MRCSTPTGQSVQIAAAAFVAPVTQAALSLRSAENLLVDHLGRQHDLAQYAILRPYVGCTLTIKNLADTGTAVENTLTEYVPREQHESNRGRR